LFLFDLRSVRDWKLELEAAQFYAAAENYDCANVPR
jgi:hypothetical protein